MRCKSDSLSAIRIQKLISFFCPLSSFSVFSSKYCLTPVTQNLLLSGLSFFSTSTLFPASPPHSCVLPPAGCKMDSPQSESSGEGQKAEENRAQGELQRGRRHSSVLWPVSSFLLLLLRILALTLFSLFGNFCFPVFIAFVKLL